MSNLDQLRVPEGSPEGGQFTRGGGRPEADSIRLCAPLDGSFKYPPVADSAEELAEFWAECPVSDAVLDRMRDHCIAVRDYRIKMHVDRWVADNPAPASGAAREAWDSAHAQISAQASTSYFSPNRGDYRTLARLNQMMRTSPDCLTSVESERLRERQFQLPGSGETGTAASLLGRYGADTVDLDKLPVKDETNVVAGQLAMINQALSDINARDELRDAGLI